MSKGLRWSQSDLDAAMKRNRHLAAENQVVSPVTQTPEDSPVKPKKTGRKRGQMTKTEVEYARILDAKRLKGEILEWEYEPFRVRYGSGAYYTPDFVVILPGADQTIDSLRRLSETSVLEIPGDIAMFGLNMENNEGLIEFHEIKGGHIFPAAKERFRAAKLRYSWIKFRMIQKKAGEWKEIG